MHDGGVEPPHFATALVAALQKHFAGRRRFKAASAVISGWKSEAVPNQAPPFPRVVLHAVVVALAGSHHANVAVSLLLAFCGLLRISEVLTLRWLDVVLPHQHKGESNLLILCLGRTKTAPADQHRVLIQSASIVRFVYLYRNLVPHQDLDPFAACSYSTVRKWLQRALTAYGFDASSFRTHSCRRGGATEMARLGYTLPQIMLAGRWQSDKSCKLYLQRAEVALTRVRAGVSNAQWEVLHRVAALGPHILEPAFYP